MKVDKVKFEEIATNPEEFKREEPDPQVEEKPAPVPDKATIGNCISVNIRKGTDPHTDVVATLKSGTVVTVEKKISDYARVITKEGLKGFLPFKFLVFN